MQLPNSIKSLLSQLCSNQQFSLNLRYYTKVALQSLLYPVVTSQSCQCPTAYLLALTHYIQKGIPLQQFGNELPQSLRDQFGQTLKTVQKESSIGCHQLGGMIINDSQSRLVDTKWKAYIQNGREVWQVQLILANQIQPIVLKLNYQELSLFAFKVNQLVGHVKSIDIDQII